MLSSEIRDMNEGDINARIAELEEERFRLKFRAGTETLEDPLRLRVIRKDVARLKTVLKEKIIGIDQAHLTDAQTKPARKTKAGGAKTRRVRRTRSGATRSKKRA
jgi:large subunit ribosomal protein L29